MEGESGEQVGGELETWHHQQGVLCKADGMRQAEDEPRTITWHKAVGGGNDAAAGTVTRPNDPRPLTCE